jgi:hypothetical protein
MKPEDFYWAIILKIWPDEPVFHAPHYESTPSGRYHSTGATRCGRYISAFTPWLPRKHAAKFARPCKGCFDEVS